MRWVCTLCMVGFIIYPLAWGAEPQVARLHWVDPWGRQPGGYQDYCTERGEVAPVQREPLFHTIARRGSPRAPMVALVVNASLAPRIEDGLATYTADLEAEGYAVGACTWSGGSVDDLKGYLVELGDSLVGAVLVGDLPVAWYEDGSEEFLCDLYLMDLDGDWQDADSDGLFDSHTNGSGDVAPEIWVGRICASRLTWGSEVSLLRYYFEKVHDYRTGGLSLPDLALSYVDDDWSGFEDCGLSLAYADVIVENSDNTTVATDYKAHLLQGYEFIQICAHSCCWAHTFMINGGYWGGGSIYNYEIHDHHPCGLFYNLFACSNTRWTETDNLGNWYIFGDPYGLTVVGSTKAGSMLVFEDFYGPLGEGDSFGEAYRTWWVSQAQDGYEEWEVLWYYGLNILGDPTLHIHGGTGSREAPKPQRLPVETDSHPGTTEWTVYQVSSDTCSEGRPALCADHSGTVWATWESGHDVRSNIYSSRFDGDTWSPAEDIYIYTYWDVHPAMALDSTGTAWCVWQSLVDYGFEIKASSDDGNGWSYPQRLTTSDAYDLEPSVATAWDGTLWCAWKGWLEGNAEILWSCYVDEVWTEPAYITEDPADDTDPVLVRDHEGVLWLVWSTNRDGDWNLYWSTNDGSGWTSPTPLTTDGGHDMDPAIAADGSGKVWVIWQSDRDGDMDIYSSYNDGSGWSSPIPVATDLVDDVSPVVVCDHSGGVWAVWMRFFSGRWALFWSYSDGVGWRSPQRVVEDGYSQYDPALTVDADGDIWVAWATPRDGDWNIYAASHPSSGVAEEREDHAERWGLRSIHPNPTAGESEFLYSLASPSQVRLSVYDVSGRKMATLVDGSKVSGVHTARWKAPATGIFFCRLETEKSTFTRRLVVVR